MKFLSDALLWLAGIIFIAGVIKVIKEERKYADKGLDFKSKKKEISRIIGFLIVVCLVGSCWVTPSDQEEKAKKMSHLTAKQQDSVRRDSTIKSLFSEWDGTDKELTKYVKDNMNDADSFENVSTTYFDMGNYIVINMKYRGKNAFGAKVLNFVKAKQNIDGSNLEILETQP